jgi:hypothetical protein
VSCHQAPPAAPVIGIVLRHGAPSPMTTRDGTPGAVDA